MVIEKKLLGAKKAWNSLTSGVQSKLRKLNISKAKKYATRLLSGLNSIRRLVSSKRRRKSQALKGPNSALRYDHHHKHCGQQQLQKGFAAIYVDLLFEEAEVKAGPGETSKGKEVVAESGNGSKTITGAAKTKASGKSGCTVSDAWKAAVASSPQLRGVDERADEFISEFHRRMKLEREHSILDLQEMLERSA